MSIFLTKIDQAVVLSVYSTWENAPAPFLASSQQLSSILKTSSANGCPIEKMGGSQ